MALDRELVREIRKELGDGSREARIEFLHKVYAAAKDLSTTDVRRTFGDCLKAHGRPAVAVCVAATLAQRRERLDCWNMVWASEVLDTIPSFTLSNLDRAAIYDGIHPTAICEYAGSFIKLTTEN